MSQNLEKFKEKLEEFGLEEEVKNLKIIVGNKSARISNKKNVEISGTEGVVLFRKGKVWNPTSNLIFVFGHKVKKRIVDITKSELMELCEKGIIKKDTDYYGFVVLKYDVYPICLGFSKNGEIKSFMPKEFRKNVLESIEEYSQT